MDNHGIFVLSRADNARFFECTSHRHGAFVCILYHVCQCFGWGGVGLITFLGSWGGGDDNVLDSTFLMFHLNEVTFMFLRWSLLGWGFGGWGEAMITFLIVRSWCFILMKWHTCCYAVHSSWYNFDLAKDNAWPPWRWKTCVIVSVLQQIKFFCLWIDLHRPTDLSLIVASWH